jgi:PKD domain
VVAQSRVSAFARGNWRWLVACTVAVITSAWWCAAASGAGGQLQYHGGPVLHSSAPYLVFWTPTGESIPASSESLLARYLSDVAADSGKSTNVFAVDRQYYDSTGFADYRQTFNAARQVIVDRHPYPPRDTQCPEVAAAYPTCISDDELQPELQRLITADHLPNAGRAFAPELSANAPIYLIIVPGDVNVCYFFDTRCFSTNSCSTHTYFVDNHGDYVLYAVQSMRIYAKYRGLVWPKICQYDGNAVAQEPNGDNADVLLTHLSQGLNGTITDPINATSGWFNTSTGNEVGDNCFGYGPVLPHNNPNSFLPTLGGSETAGTLYTQLINGHRYYTQSEWSNGDRNCEMRPSPGMIVPRFTTPAGSSKAGAVVRLDPGASTSTNPYSSATWNFGDRSQTAFFHGNGTLALASHRYRSAGRYTVTLTLVDDRGNLQTTSGRVTVVGNACVVPSRAAHCALGKVSTPHRPTHPAGRHKRWKLLVARQSPSPASAEPGGTEIQITLMYTAVAR